MSDIKNKERILEAIDQLRRRKARPDVDRICNFLLRRFSVCSKDTLADLERMVRAEIVIRVEYKGNISYRNAAKWSKLSLYKHKGTILENNIIEVRSLLSRAFASLLVEDPDYLDFGVPENELKKSMLEEDPCLEWGDVEAVLQREINSGYLVRLQNNNYSLADHPVPTCTTNGNSDISNDVHMLKFESSPHFDEGPNNFEGNEEIAVSVKVPSPKATDGNNRKIAESPDVLETRETETDSADQGAASAINIAGFRVGVRRKRAKKVFDPSDNNVPIRKRGRPLGSTNKNKDVMITVTSKVDPAVAVCTICRLQVNSRRGQYEKFLTCANCPNKAHPSCLDVGDKLLPFWQCMQCKMCPQCYQSGEFKPLVVCWGCGDGWHPFCHSPEIIERTSGSKWYCYQCIAAKPKNNVNGMDNLSTPRASPTPDATPVSYPASASVTSADSDEQIDECIPDASGWSVEQVCRYLVEQGYPEEAAIFKLHEIDGASLLLMKRSDVLSGLKLKLGPALKLYGQVKRLQIRQNDPQLIWA